MTTRTHVPKSITVVGQFACAAPVPGLHWQFTWVYAFPFPMMNPPAGFLFEQLMHWFRSVKCGLEVTLAQLPPPPQPTSRDVPRPKDIVLEPPRVVLEAAV
jgi:hypothetical protein